MISTWRAAIPIFCLWSGVGVLACSGSGDSNSDPKKDAAMTMDMGGLDAGIESEDARLPERDTMAVVDVSTATDMGATPMVDMAVARDASPPIDARSTGDARPLDAGPDADMARLDLGPPVADQGPAPVDLGRPDARPIQLSETRCNDGEDDDNDDRVDCEDPDCRGAGVCFDRREICDDGRDNNGDFRVDCEDVTCHGEPGCPLPDVRPFTTRELQLRIDRDCDGCHALPQPESQMDLARPFENAVINVMSTQVLMALVEPGDRDRSFMYQKIRYRQVDFMGDGEGMPPDTTWTAADAERFGLWIDNLPPN